MNSKWFRVILIAVLCIVVFCFIATASQIITIGELPANFVAVFLEAAVTAVITVVLLTGQSSAEEVKERNVAVFNNKTKVFKKFIKNLWATWDDHKIDREEYSILTSSFYRELMLYLNAESQRTIGNALRGISDCIGIVADEGSAADEKLREFIVTVMNTLIKELSLGGVISPDLFKDLDRKLDEADQQSLDSPVKVIAAAGRGVRSPRTTFKMLGIEKGTRLVFKDDPSIICVTEDETNKVLFNGNVRTISNVSDELMKRPSNGFACFTLNGNTLWDMRQKLEYKGLENNG
jgi:hypothetical protein